MCMRIKLHKHVGGAIPAEVCYAITTNCYCNWLCKYAIRKKRHSTCLLDLKDIHNAFW